jgi:hypothetical protein
MRYFFCQQETHKENNMNMPAGYDAWKTSTPWDDCPCYYATGTVMLFLSYGMSVDAVVAAVKHDMLEFECAIPHSDYIEVRYTLSGEWNGFREDLDEDLAKALKPVKELVDDMDFYINGVSYQFDDGDEG